MSIAELKELTAREVWAEQNELLHSYVGQDKFFEVEQRYRDQGKWHMKVRTYMQETTLTADTPYLVVQKAINTLADGWEELKLTRNGEL